MDNTTDTANEAQEEVKLDDKDVDTQLEDNVEELVQEEKKPAEDFKEKYFYLAAEMQNMQRRFDKDKEDLLKYGSEKILKDMLDIVDNLERTLGFIKTDEDVKVKNIVVGIEMISKMFLDSLQKHGLKVIEALGAEFDPHFHEALAQQPAEGKKHMEVIEVHQSGYTLNDRVIRPAKVIVANNN